MNLPTDLMKLLTYFTLMCIFISCFDKNDFKDFPDRKWHEDSKGCKGFREKYFKEIILNKGKFEGMDDDKLAGLLGKPDKIFYSKRGKKTYEYFVTPGKQCDKELRAEGSKIVFEINSVGYVNLIFEKKF